MWDSILLLLNTENFDFNPHLKILSYIQFSRPDFVYQMSKLYVVDGNNDKRENKGRTSFLDLVIDENQKDTYNLYRGR